MGFCQAEKGSKMFLRKLAVVTLLGSVPFSALAQGNLQVNVAPTVSCAEASFEVGVVGGSAPYTLDWDFGDGESLAEAEVLSPHVTRHTYPGSGDFAWSLRVADGAASVASTQGTLTIAGPQVTLTSDPFPPLLALSEGQAGASFTADASGGIPPYLFTWDLDGDGNTDDAADPTSNSSTFTYDAAGKYLAAVTVQDACGLTASDTLPVLVEDPTQTLACHPMAQRIADAVNTLFPSQAEDLYTCEDIFAFFEGGLTGSQLGFGRMWHAYRLTQTIDELTWEEILDWHLDGRGWGLLVQLDRLAGALDEVSITDLMERVMSGENSVNQIRTAVRAATRYDADIEDALARLASGVSNGELAQFYRTANDLEVDPAELDGYLDSGASLAEIRHAASLAERSGADWRVVVDAHTQGHSWGEISQAYRLADQQNDAAAILEVGVQEYRRQTQQESRTTRQAEQDQRTASNLARQFGVPQADILQVFGGECNGDWICVRAHFRTNAGDSHNSGDDRTASQIARKYGVDEAQVWALFNGACRANWGCVREQFRNQGGAAPEKSHP